MVAQTQAIPADPTESEPHKMVVFYATTLGVIYFSGIITRRGSSVGGAVGAGGV